MSSLVSVSDNLKIWSWDDGYLQEKSTYHVKNENFYSVTWNHSNQVIAIGGKEPRINLVQANTGQMLSHLQLSDSKLTTLKIKAVAFSNNSRLLATSIGSPIQLWDLKKRQIKAMFTGHRTSIAAISFNANSDLFAADDSGDIKLWTSKSSIPLQSFSDSLSPSGLFCMQLSPISNLLAAGYGDGSIRVWDSSLVNHPCLRNQSCHTNKISSLSCSSKNARLISTASPDGYLRLIDIESKDNAPAAEINAKLKLTSVSFHEDGIHCAVGCKEGQILIYDWRSTKEPLFISDGHCPSPVNALSFQLPVQPKSSDQNSVVSRSDTIRSASPSSTRTSNSQYDSITPTKRFPNQTKPSPVASSLRESLESLNKLELEAKILTPQAKPLPSSSSDYQNKTQKETIVSSPIPAATNNLKFNKIETPKPATTVIPIRKSMEGPNTPKPAFTFKDSDYDEPQYNDNNDLEEKSYEPAHHNITMSFSKRVKEFLDSEPMNDDLDEIAVNMNEKMENNTSLPTEKNGQHAIYYDMSDPSTRPITKEDLEESLELLKYDFHREVQEIIKEQTRQFCIAKEESANQIKQLTDQLADLIQANKELRAENEYLRKIY